MLRFKFAPNRFSASRDNFQFVFPFEYSSVNPRPPLAVLPLPFESLKFRILNEEFRRGSSCEPARLLGSVELRTSGVLQRKVVGFLRAGTDMKSIPLSTVNCSYYNDTKILWSATNWNEFEGKQIAKQYTSSKKVRPLMELQKAWIVDLKTPGASMLVDQTNVFLFLKNL